MDRRHFLRTAGALAALASMAPTRARAREAAHIALLLPLSGEQAALGRMLAGTAQAAVAAVARQHGAGSRRITATIEDTQSDPVRFGLLARVLGSGPERAVSLFGPCPASVRPDLGVFLERAGGLLWDPDGYEGGDCSAGIIHGGATPHQSLKQMLPFLAAEVGPNFLLVGDNGLYSQGMSRVARWAIERMGASVVGEAVSRDEHRAWLARVESGRVDVVFCSLQGAALVEFLRAFHAAGLDSLETPIASPCMSELEARACGPGVAAGHVACQPYFASLRTLGNDRFLATLRRSLGRQFVPTALAESLWGQIHLFARAIAVLDDIPPHPVLVREVVKGSEVLLPQGRVAVQADGLHARLWPKIGVAQADGSFKVVARSDRAIDPVPFWGLGSGACAPQLAADPD